MKDIVVFSLIHFVVPLLGILIYTKLSIKMQKEKIEKPPIVQLFWMFGTYGVFLILLLTEFFWKWSGMASIGLFVSFTIGSLIALFSGMSLFKNRNLSKYHKFTFYLSITYLLIVAISILIAYSYK